MSYVKEALRTEAPITEEMITRAERLVRTTHAVTGLNTELIELYLGGDARNIKEELGDLLWYVAILCDEWDLTYCASEFEVGEPYQSLMSGIGQITDLFKRALFYKQTFEPILAQQAVSNIIYNVAAIANQNGFSLRDVEECNITKLKARYPEKFNEHDAVNRDTNKELEDF